MLLVLGTAIAVYLCYLIALPFLSSLLWAAALAVLAFPLYRRVDEAIGHPNVSATILTVFIAVAVVVPTIIAVRSAAQELWVNARYVVEQMQANDWRAQVEQNQYAGWLLDHVEGDAGLAGVLEQAVNSTPAFLSGFLSESIWIAFQLLVTFFALFFFFRDSDFFIRGLRRLLPLERGETDRVFDEVSNTLFATVFGEVLIATLQGLAGGLLFWSVGVPAPVLWGFIMGLFGFLPAIGAWMVWTPVGIYLIMQGRLWAGVVVLVGGALIMLGTTLLYPVLVGERLKLHTLLVFIAIIGGIMAFGTVGIILGPLTLVIAKTLLSILRDRAVESNDDEEFDDGVTLPAPADS